VKPSLDAKSEIFSDFNNGKKELEDVCSTIFLIEDMENTNNLEEFLTNGDFKPYFWKDLLIPDEEKDLIKEHWINKMSEHKKDLHDKNINWLEYIKNELIKIINEKGLDLKYDHLILIVPLQNNIKKELTEALKKIVNNENVKKEDVEKIGTSKIDTPIKLPLVKPSEDTKKELSETENRLNEEIKSLKKELKDIEKEKSYTKNINKIIDRVKKSSKNKLDSNLKEQTLKNVNWLKNKLNGIIFDKDKLNEIIKEFSINNRGKDRIDYLSNLFKQHLGNKKTIKNLIKEFKKKQVILALENENSIINKNIQELKIQLSKEKITKNEKNRINTLINKFNGKISNNKFEKDVIEGKSIEPDEIKLPEFPKLEDKEKLDLEIDFICNKNPELYHVKLYEQLLKELNDPNIKIDNLKHNK
ncbi:21557_t:CDS:2, partial [Gigaspora margarita]